MLNVTSKITTDQTSGPSGNTFNKKILVFAVSGFLACIIGATFVGCFFQFSSTTKSDVSTLYNEVAPTNVSSINPAPSLTLKDAGVFETFKRNVVAHRLKLVGATFVVVAILSAVIVSVVVFSASSEAEVVATPDSVDPNPNGTADPLVDPIKDKPETDYSTEIGASVGTVLGVIFIVAVIVFGAKFCKRSKITSDPPTPVDAPIAPKESQGNVPVPLQSESQHGPSGSGSSVIRNDGDNQDTQNRPIPSGNEEEDSDDDDDDDKNHKGYTLIALTTGGDFRFRYYLFNGIRYLEIKDTNSLYFDYKLVPIGGMDKELIKKFEELSAYKTTNYSPVNATCSACQKVCLGSRKISKDWTFTASVSKKYLSHDLEPLESGPITIHFNVEDGIDEKKYFK